MQTLVNRLGWVLAALISLTVLAALAGVVRGGPLDPPAPPASTAGVRQPGTAITSIPYTITAPGFYYLTGNLTIAAPGDGITINGQGVTLDLNGFTLTGSGKNGSGVLSNGQGDVIRNGHTTNWNNGLQEFDAAVSNITAMGNATGFALFGGTLDGCFVNANTIGISADGSVIRNCDIEGGSSTGLSLSSDNEVYDSKFWANGNFGPQYDIEVHGNNNVIRENYTSLSAFHEDFIGVFPGATATLITRNRWSCSNGIVDNGTSTFIPAALAEDTNYCS